MEAATPPQKRQCAAIKRNGERCGAWAVTDRDQCAGHLRLGASAEDADAVRRLGTQRSAEVQRDRAEERKKSLHDHISAALSTRAEEIVAAYLEAGLDRGDWRALEALVTRQFGKPTERVEVSEGEVDVAQLSPEQRAQLRERLYEQFPHLREVA
jgi:hypothetical protein